MINVRLAFPSCATGFASAFASRTVDLEALAEPVAHKVLVSFEPVC